MKDRAVGAKRKPRRRRRCKYARFAGNTGFHCGVGIMPGIFSMEKILGVVKQAACGAISGVRLWDSFDNHGTRTIHVGLTIQDQEVEVIRTVDAGGDDKICSIDHSVSLPRAIFRPIVGRTTAIYRDEE